jgi:hypothetical protein
MNIFKKFFLFVVLVTTGCGSLGVRTDVYSYKDPFCATKSIKKIMVFANTQDMKYQDEIESAFIKYFESWNYDCIVVKSVDVVIPTRTYTKNEMQQLFKSNDLDVILVFTVKNAGYDHQKFTYNEPYKTYGNIYSGGANTYYYNTRTYGGPQTYDFYKPYLSAIADIYDIETGLKIWTAQLISMGNAFANINDTLNDAIKTSVLKMEQDGVVKKQKNRKGY